MSRQDKVLYTQLETSLAQQLFVLNACRYLMNRTTSPFACGIYLGKLQQAPGQHGGGEGKGHPILDKACSAI